MNLFIYSIVLVLLYYGWVRIIKKTKVNIIPVICSMLIFNTIIFIFTSILYINFVYMFKSKIKGLKI